MTESDNYVKCPICGAEHTDHTGNKPCENCGVMMDMPINGALELVTEGGG